MKGTKVLDSWPLLAYFEGEESSAKVTELLKGAAEKGRDLLISVVNWGEVLYVIESRYGKEKRAEVEHLMNQMHLEVVDVDRNLTREASHFKAAFKLPYADCFTAALARLKKASVVTGDRDFERLKNDVKIEWS